MKLVQAALAGALAAALVCPAAQAQVADTTADALFTAGQFEQAEGIYQALVKADPADADALTRLGEIALYSNRLDEAQDWLEKAIAARAGSTLAQVLLAETFYRADDFKNAARAFEAAGAAAAALPTAPSFSTLILDKLQSFGETKPNVITGSGDSTVLKFLKTDPLPVVRVSVNGKEANFFIDTGGAEAIVDTQFAKELGIPQYSKSIGLFAGGQSGAASNGKIETLKLGDWTLSNVPVQIIDTRTFSEGFGLQIDGCIGTIVLSKFLPTLDYGKAELVLRQKSASLPKEAPAGSVTVPFWLGGDHFIVAFGSINAMPQTLFFLDSGMTSGVNIRQQIFDVAGIKPEEDKASEAQGGGGTFTSVPYTVANVDFGGWKETDVPGVFDGPQAAEDRFGFYVQGLIGHRFFNPHAVTFDFTAMQLRIQ